VNDVHALSGAYAVDALDDIERAAFERHLADCADCRAEVAGLREAASLLAETATTEPPAGLRDRVLAGIATVRPLPPAIDRPAVDPKGARAPRRRFRMAVVAAAAAVIAAVGVGAAVTEPWANDQSSVGITADAVLSATDARSTKLDFDNGATATVTHSDTVGRAVLVTRKMPAPPPGKVYQLWLQQPDVGMVSAGLMPVKADQRVLLQGDAATAIAAGITVEPAGGSTEPTTKPIALFDFGRAS
jgi:anti-sigma-K factor RskA